MEIQIADLNKYNYESLREREADSKQKIQSFFAKIPIPKSRPPLKGGHIL